MVGWVGVLLGLEGIFFGSVFFFCEFFGMVVLFRDWVGYFFVRMGFRD